MGTSAHIGRAIRAARETAGLTQHELGERIGVRWLTISRYERGESQVSLARLDQIARALDRHTADLVREAA
jgi:transcriptional regulator with XRE-family HTH domain